MKSMIRALSLSLGLALVAPAYAGTLAGVTLPDSATIGDQTVVLNGMGLREKFFIDVYVGGLYLPEKTSDASKAINSDVPKRIVMAMTYELEKEKLSDMMKESISKADSPEVSSKADTLASWMEDVSPGDQIVLEYMPGKGTSVIGKGKTKGTIAGSGMMKALWGIYLGPNPPTSALKKGLLGQ